MPSQLKSLKASLRQQGVLGPQPSKKERQRGGKPGAQHHRQRRAEALAEIRERFNPFEVKKLARGSKHEVANGTSADAVQARPGLTKGVGEEVRRNTLLKEVRMRQKVGGLVDRRFGEKDPTMTAEEKALQRFIREQQGPSRKVAMFDLEDGEGGEDALTHNGRSLGLMEIAARDDFDDADLRGSDDGTDEEGSRRAQKRQRLEAEERSDAEEGAARDARPKTKKEVMKEVIAKSKLHKYERQQAKEGDEDLRDELDAGLRDMLQELRGSARAAPIAKPAEPDPSMNPDRAALLAGKDREDLDREYDIRLRQMTQDARAQPTVPTKTEEEKAQDEAQRLQDLEEKRLRRMRGESVSDEEKEQKSGGDYEFHDDFDEDNILGKGVPVSERKPLDVEDEDEFELDEDLVAEGSDLEFESPSESEEDNGEDSDDQEFVAGLLSQEDAGRIKDGPAPESKSGTKVNPALPFTYACPQTHEDLLKITGTASYEDLHIIIQRIRALHHPRLAEGNKDKLGTFATVLVQHVAYLGVVQPRPPFATFEALIRHVHSLAKSHPVEVANAYRDHLNVVHSRRPLDLELQDVLILTAINTTFPTSDHFHPVATPATMTLARFLGQKYPQSLADLAAGLYACTLSLRYQRLAKRYVPEVVNFLLNALAMLDPAKPKRPVGYHPLYESAETLRISKSIPSLKPRKLQLTDIQHEAGDAAADEALKHALFAMALDLIQAASNLWASKASYPEIFTPFLNYLQRESDTAQRPSALLLQSLRSSLQHSIHASVTHRRPLALHNHRPLPIKSNLPKFEVDFNPHKHYDADAGRAESARLRKDHRRERKGAMRELRKDTAFLAREGLKEQVERDAAYADKYRKLVARVQAEEGREAGAYEREKRARKGKR